METSSFNKLSLHLKAKVIHEFASPVLSIEYYDHRINLFALNSSLIEHYQNLETGRVDKIAEAGYHDLDKYLSRIVIGSLKINLKNH
jgi:hypothetical protein